MTDTHIRFLRLLAHRSQRELAHHNSIHQIDDATSRQRGARLELAATRTRVHLAHAQTRRHWRRPDRMPSPQQPTDERVLTAPSPAPTAGTPTLAKDGYAARLTQGPGPAA